MEKRWWKSNPHPSPEDLFYIFSAVLVYIVAISIAIHGKFLNWIFEQTLQALLARFKRRAIAVPSWLDCSTTVARLGFRRRI